MQHDCRSSCGCRLFCRSAGHQRTRGRFLMPDDIAIPPLPFTLPRYYEHTAASMLAWDDADDLDAARGIFAGAVLATVLIVGVMCVYRFIEMCAW